MTPSSSDEDTVELSPGDSLPVESGMSPDEENPQMDKTPEERKDVIREGLDYLREQKGDPSKAAQIVSNILKDTHTVEVQDVEVKVHRVPSRPLLTFMRKWQQFQQLGDNLEDDPNTLGDVEETANNLADRAAQLASAIVVFNGEPGPAEADVDLGVDVDAIPSSLADEIEARDSNGLTEAFFRGSDYGLEIATGIITGTANEVNEDAEEAEKFR